MCCFIRGQWNKTASCWFLNVGIVKENKTRGSSRSRTGHFREYDILGEKLWLNVFHSYSKKYEDTVSLQNGLLENAFKILNMVTHQRRSFGKEARRKRGKHLGIMKDVQRISSTNYKNDIQCFHRILWDYSGRASDPLGFLWLSSAAKRWRSLIQIWEVQNIFSWSWNYGKMWPLWLAVVEVVDRRHWYRTINCWLCCLWLTWRYNISKQSFQ